MNPISTYLGTELKFKVKITAPGFSMENDDFTIQLVNKGVPSPRMIGQTVSRNVSRTYHKDELVIDDNGDYYLCFNTEDFGIGLITAIITAYVPDTAFLDGLRTEVYKTDLVNIDMV